MILWTTRTAAGLLRAAFAATENSEGNNKEDRDGSLFSKFLFLLSLISLKLIMKLDWYRSTLRKTSATCRGESEGGVREMGMRRKEKGNEEEDFSQYTY